MNKIEQKMAMLKALSEAYEAVESRRDRECYLNLPDRNYEKEWHQRSNEDGELLWEDEKQTIPSMDWVHTEYGCYDIGYIKRFADERSGYWNWKECADLVERYKAFGKILEHLEKLM